ncbi:MAG TPA: YceI family protein [Ilumatobacteraceae bacterium]|nr:YceI family protein [Ilumatobacteraceae bacterium]
MTQLTTPTALEALTAGTWTVDPSHSNITFVARHLVVAKVRGRFTDFAGTITVADDPLQTKLEATVQATSVNTEDEGRDGHLRSADFFDVENHPTWTLVSTGIEGAGSEYVLHTNLTIKGVTKPVDFALEFEGVATDPWGNTKAGFTAEAEINRKDWGLEWNVALETGGVLVGEKVKIVLEVEALKG